MGYASLDIGRAAWRGRQGAMAADAGLDACLLVGAEDVVSGAQGLALPHARIEVQNRPGLLSEVRVTRKDPVFVPPRLEGIGLQHPPHRAATERFAQSLVAPCGDVS